MDIHDHIGGLCGHCLDHISKTAWWCFHFTILKYDGVRQWVSDDIPYMKWKIKVMFETTNQLKIICPMSIHMFVVHPSDFSYLKPPNQKSSIPKLEKVSALKDCQPGDRKPWRIAGKP